MSGELFLKKVLIAVGISLSFVANAETVRIASGVPPKHPATNPLYTEFQKQLPAVSNGKLDATLLGPEIVKLPGMRDGIKSGLVDIGLFLPAYFPADLPEINLVADLAFLGRNPQAMGAAMTEYVVTCSECQAELKKLGVVYGSSHSTNTYDIISKTPIRTLADMKGKRLRTGGPQFSRWATALGAAPQRIPVGETFQALSQGVIDGTVASTADIVSFRLAETIGYITVIDLGTYHSTISHAIRRDKWTSLSANERRALVETSSNTSALSVQQWKNLAALGIKQAGEAKVQVIKADESLKKATKDFVKEDLKAHAKVNTEKGIKNATEKIARFEKLIAKWEGIATKNANDPAAMGASVVKEVWSKVDFNKYGM